MLRMRSGALRILITRSELLAERQTAWPLRDQSWRCDNPRARCPSGLPRWWTCVQPQLPPHGQRPSSLPWHPLLCDADLFEEMRIPIPVVFVRSPARETFVRSQLACLGLSQLARGAALADASAHPRTGGAQHRKVSACTNNVVSQQHCLRVQCRVGGSGRCAMHCVSGHGRHADCIRRCGEP